MSDTSSLPGSFPPTAVRSSAGRGEDVQRAVRVPKTAELVADQIRRRIIRGELREGDFLPLEGDVMASFGISRPTLREAFRILEAEGLISVMRGSRSGAKVHLPSTENASRYAGFVLQGQGTTVADIYEARLAIEPYVVRRLAQTQPAGAVARLRREVDRLQAMLDEQRHFDFMIALADFHSQLVEESGMRTLLFLTQLLHEVLRRYQLRFLEISETPVALQRKRTLAGVSSMRKLIDLIEAGQADQAESHWRLHLVNSNSAWVPAGHETKVVDLFC